jgi:tetratricopeptide (TPR) repeat protein
MNRKQSNQSIKQNKDIFFSNYPPYIFLLGIIAVTFAAYFNSFFFDFNYRDDVKYIIDNYLIRDLSPNGIKRIFTENYYQGRLPLTILSLAFDYHFWQLDAFGYHVTSFSLHVCNIILVYFFVKEISGKENVSLIAAMMFALHPAGVQTVTWISERKNVLYATFYLLAAFQYVRYAKTNKALTLVLSWIFFVCSVASKWSAYPFPVIIMFIDWYYGRKLSVKLVAEKIIFLVVPFISAYIHLESGSILPERFTFYNRIFFGSYSYLFYLVKSVIPLKLSTIYPFPKVTENEMPTLFYLSLPAALATVGILIYRVYKYTFLRKEIVLGYMFFLANIGMVLHIILFIGGHEMTADRYGYIPFVGLFFIFSEVIVHVYERNYSYRKIIMAALTGYFLWFAIYTYYRNEAWRDTVSIYRDALDKDENMPIVHAHLANYYRDHDKKMEALKEYNTCTKKFPYYRTCFYERGTLYYENGFYKEAKADLLKAIAMDSTEKFQYNFLGLAETETGNYQNAIYLFNKTLSIDSTFASGYNNLGWAYFNLNNYTEAEKYFDKAIALEDTLLNAYINRGWLMVETKRYEAAIKDFNTAQKLSPDNALIYNNRGWAYFNLSKFDEAMKDFNTAIQKNPRLNYSYYNRARTYFALNNNEAGCNDLRKAVELKHEQAAYMLQEKCLN